MIDYTKMRDHAAAKSSTEVDAGLRNYMLSVYNYMSMALVVTGIAAFISMNFDPISRLLFTFSEYGQLTGNTFFGLLVMISPVAIAFYFFYGAATININTAKTILWVYAALTGMSLSSLGFVYTGTSIARTFFICASMFGAMSIYGYTTKRDLTNMGSFLIMGLIGLIIASVVNLFVASSAIYFATSVLGVFIFIGLIAWDVQKIKAAYFAAPNREIAERMGIVGAFALYLDFINLFLYLIRFFGVKRDE